MKMFVQIARAPPGQVLAATVLAAYPETRLEMGRDDTLRRTLHKYVVIPQQVGRPNCQHFTFSHLLMLYDVYM